MTWSHVIEALPAHLAEWTTFGDLARSLGLEKGKRAMLRRKLDAWEQVKRLSVMQFDGVTHYRMAPVQPTREQALERKRVAQFKQHREWQRRLRS